MDDQAKFAFASVSDVSKQLLTLATGVLALEITFAKDIARNPTNFDVWLLELSWVLLALSILGGLLTLMALTGTVGQENVPKANGVYGVNIRMPFYVQFLAFLFAVVLSLFYGLRGI